MTAHEHHHSDSHHANRPQAHSQHAHSHAPAEFGVAFAIGTVLNFAFVAVEFGYGVLANSIALMADAGHNLGDVLGLVMAWVAMVLARRAPSQTYTYGMRRGTILAALVNAVLLLVAVGAIAVESVRRLVTPGEVASQTVMAVAAIGVVVNGFTAWLFARGRKGDINLRAAFQHMLADAFVSLGVVVAGGLILVTGWSRLDPLVSLIVAGVIVVGTWRLLRDSLSMSLDSVPVGVRPDDVSAFLLEQPGVAAIHDLHIWSLSTTETALTCHCLMPSGHPGDEFLVQLARDLHEHFGIGHATVQVEVHADVACELEPAHVV